MLSELRVASNPCRFSVPLLSAEFIRVVAQLDGGERAYTADNDDEEEPSKVRHLRPHPAVDEIDAIWFCQAAINPAKNP